MQAFPENNSSYLPLVAVLGWQESPPESVHLMVPKIQESQTSHPEVKPYSIILCCFPLFYSFCSQETVTMVCENLHWILNRTTNKHHPAGLYGALTALRTALVIQIPP